MLEVLDDLQDLLTRVDLTVHHESLLGVAVLHNDWARQAMSLMIDPFTFELRIPPECECLIQTMPSSETTATD